VRSDGRPPATAAEPFGDLLRRHRLAAVLTQERLAERAGISATGIAALEVGRRRSPRATTVALLLDALGLEGPDREAMIAAAVSPTIGVPPPATRLRPASNAPAHAGRRFAGNFAGVQRRYRFVGRHDELGRLGAAWERRVRVLIVSGEAGAGKTRLGGILR
jgi:transcriptional regulator with XRE-family HTH domain